MNDRHRWVRPAAAVLALGLLVAACGGDDDDSKADSKGSTTSTAASTLKGDGLRIGVLFPESGSLSGIIGALRTPVDLAVQEINAAGGVNGQDVVVGAADDGTDDTNQADAGFDRLVDSDKVQVLLGPASSTLTDHLMSKIKRSDIVACSGSNTAATLEDKDDGGHYFGFAPNDNLQGPALAEVVSDDGRESVAILERNDTYGTGFAKAVESALKDAGIDVVLNRAYDPTDATGYQADVQAVVDAKPDSVVVLGFGQDGGKIISQMISLNVGPGKLPIYTGDGMKDSGFYKNVDLNDPAVVQGIKGTAPAAAPQGVESPFTAAYAKTGEDTIFSAYYYDCAIVTALAAQQAQSLKPADIAAAIPKVVAVGEACHTYADCKALLDAGKDIDYNGASGRLDLDDRGHVLTGYYDVWQYDAQGKDATLDVPQIRIGRE
jgi:branched-chain amino acid transport system substrate-binding protein